MGHIYWDLGEYSKALDKFTKTTEIDPKNIAAFYYKGLAFKELKDKSEADKAFGKATQIKPNSEHPYEFYFKDLAFLKGRDYGKYEKGEQRDKEF
ncbi:tetratricopeptide repeat protein [Methanosarcina sp. Mfa9]|uniref:tetratricopeptide repeat protein n=1 Tax=Methanosarcina sp. Mfa9 TaxID=3439063 RepID=UPI003F8570A4